MQVNQAVHTYYDSKNGLKRRRAIALVRAMTKVVPDYNTLAEFKQQVVIPALILAGSGNRADFDKYVTRYTNRLVKCGFIA